MERSAPTLAIWLSLALLVGGALLLAANRGSSILLDLSAMSAGFLCF